MKAMKAKLVLLLAVSLILILGIPGYGEAGEWKLEASTTVPVLKIGNLSGPGDLVIDLNQGEAGVGFTFSRWQNPKEQSVYDVDLGVFTHLGQSEGEDLTLAFSFVISTLKKAGFNLLQAGVYYRVSGGGEFNDRFAILLGVGMPGFYERE